GRAADMAMTHLKPGKTVRFVLLPNGQDPDDLLRSAGRDAMDTFIRSAKALSDMVWSRETENGVFDTPERKAELEDRIRGLTRIMTNDTIRRHYEQEFRERLQAFFGQTSGKGSSRRTGGFGGKTKAGGRKASFSVSRSLSQSPLVSSFAAGNASSVISPRNAVLLMTMINHPILLDRHDDAFSTLQFDQGELNRLHQVLISILAEDPEQNPTAIKDALKRRGYETLLHRLELTLASVGLWQTREQADPMDAEEGWRQALALHEKGAVLRDELRVAELALNEESTEANFARLVEIQHDLESNEHIHALIEGFGALSGQS
ncbi:MAG: DNA primase, partial [Hyphomicrobiales bacterium]